MLLGVPELKKKLARSNSRTTSLANTKALRKLTPRELEVLDWVENLIVPAMVESHIQKHVFTKGAHCFCDIAGGGPKRPATTSQ